MLPDYDADTIAVASGAVLLALIDTLIAKGVISRTDAERLFGDAAQQISGRTKNNLRDRAIQMVGAVLDRFPKNNV